MVSSFESHRLAQKLFLCSHAFPTDVGISEHQACKRNESSRRKVGTSDGKKVGDSEVTRKQFNNRSIQRHRETFLSPLTVHNKK